jgi:hypothetical protein
MERLKLLCITGNIFRSDSVTQLRTFKMVQNQYHCMSSRTTKIELLRCNKEFFGKPRYDMVLYRQGHNKYAIGQIHLLFRCKALKQTWDLALVAQQVTQERPSRSRTRWRLITDDTFRLSFIHVKSIVRRVYAQQAYEVNDDVPVLWINHHIEIGDADLFLRLPSIEGQIA